MVGTVEIDEREERLSTRGGDHADPLLGRTLLHYRIVEVLGQGGMSVVYKGRDEHLHRDVAVKVLHPFLREKAECRARLAREARAVARLEHPHILKVFDYSGDRPTLNQRPGERTDPNGQPGFHEGFIVAELVKGATLKRYAEEHDLFALPEVGAAVTWQIARALEHAHQSGVVHRDLKPENVMVREDGVLKLMDFGIAHVADQGGLTITGTLLGSPAHMAPECIEGYPADERSDLYSLGTCLYWLTTGALPFEALTPHALLKQIVDGGYQPAQQRQPRISDDLSRIIDKAIARRPEDRYESAGAFCAALEDALARAGLPVDGPRLSALLAAPATGLPEAAQTVRRAFLARATKLLDEGAPARALSALGRVLAEHPGDPDATALLERAHTIADDDVPAGQPGSSTAATTERPTPAGPRPPVLGRALLVVGALALMGAAVMVAVVVDQRAADEAAAAEASSLDGTTPAPAEPLDRSAPPPPVADPAPPPPPAVVAPAVVEKPTRDQPLHKKLEAKIVVEPPPPTRAVTLRVYPAARILVDGKPVSDVFVTTATVQLPLGAHRVAFEHPAAKEEHEEIVVSAEGPAPVVTKRLEPKPALLVVKCRPDCEVEIDGTYKGLGSVSVERPIVVPLEAGKAELEVGLFKKGYKPTIRRHTFAAGRTDTVEVVLERDPDAEGDRVPRTP